MEQFKRETVVFNGCNGSCCEAFTLSYDIEDLKRMLVARNDNKSVFIDILGSERTVMSDAGLETMIDMLIPLGFATINLNRKNDSDIINDQMISNGIKTQEDWNQHPNEEKYWYVLHEGVWKIRMFTCKHFDKEKRVCGNYESRPPMCRHFGSECHYKGCSYVSLQKIAEDLKCDTEEKESKLNESINKHEIHS